MIRIPRNICRISVLRWKISGKSQPSGSAMGDALQGTFIPRSGFSPDKPKTGG
jgi:hypothetical protein